MIDAENKQSALCLSEKSEATKKEESSGSQADGLRYTEMELIEKTFAANDENLHKAIAFVEENLEHNDASMKAIMAITVSLEEMFVNVAHYAYPDSEGDVKVGLGFKNDDVIITLTDEGIPFDPLAKEDPDVHASAQERNIGGLGIYMVKKSMDYCSYQRKGNKNIFVMRRNIRQ